MSSMSGLTTHTTTVSIVTPHDLFALGLRAMLTCAPAIRVITHERDGEPDVLLYDVIGLLDGGTEDLDHWVKETAATVVAITRSLRPDLGAVALARGASAVVRDGATTEEIVGMVLSAGAGTLEDSIVAAAAEADTRLGSEVGLSNRENDVLRLVVQGRSNVQIADDLYLSINSVKTYIRSAYRKIGTTSRSQAVAWCLRHGYPPPSA